MNFFDHLFTPTECEKIIDLGIKQGLSPALCVNQRGHERVDPITRITEKTHIYPDPKTMWIFKRFNDVSERSMIFERLQFLKYTKGSHFDWHQDWGMGNPRINARRFSWTVILNDPSEYTGCDLWVQEQDLIKQAPREQGLGVRFLSKDIHKVTHCASGTRYALTAWQLDPSLEQHLYNKKEMYFDKHEAKA